MNQPSPLTQPVTIYTRVKIQIKEATAPLCHTRHHQQVKVILSEVKGGGYDIFTAI